jgi:hypothetical protein
MAIPDEKRIANADRAVDHARELFKVNDARIVTVETQATAIVAAAITIAAFFLAAVAKETSRPSTIEIGLVLAAGGAAVMAALIARGDGRRMIGEEGQARARAVNDADDAVRAIDPAETDPVALRRMYAEAWRTRTRSTAHRLRVKRLWVKIASMALAVEFLIGALVAGAT